MDEKRILNEERSEERRDEARRDEGLSTAALAGAGQGRPEEATHVQATSGEEQAAAPLFSQNDLNEFRSSWDSIQAGFVDEPRRAVEQADKLVAAAMKRMAEGFAQERSKLEGQWDRGDNISTEDLRVALRRYRSFFHRLLSM